MLEEVFLQLYDYGFEKQDLRRIADNNTNMYSVGYDDVKKILEFLKYKGLEKKEIIALINDNPFMLTESTKRIRYFEKIYEEELKLTKDEMISILKSNSETYTASPIELEKIINYFKEKGLTIENIKERIINNPSLISKKLKEIK